MVKQLGLLNTYSSLILPVMISAFNLVVMRQFFMGIPQELIDSARIDGAGDLRILLRIVLPLSGAVHRGGGAVLRGGVLERVLQRAAVPERHQHVAAAAGAAQRTCVQGAPLPGIALAGDEAARRRPRRSRWRCWWWRLVPILLVYPFLQRYFTRGVLTGAIKG